MLSSTSDDSSLEILVQKVDDVICAMDRRQILLKPTPHRCMDGQAYKWMDRQTNKQTDRGLVYTVHGLNTCAEISRKSISWFNIFIMDRVNYERLLPLLFQNIGQ